MNVIPGFPNYFATEDGRIWSVPRPHTKGGFLKTPIRRRYPAVSLCRDGRHFVRTVHHIVALAFLGPCPDGMEVRHLDGSPANSAVRNLRYGTKSENMQDKVVHGTNHNLNKTQCAEGHDFTPENTYIQPGKPNWRYCRRCRADRSRRRTATPRTNGAS